MKIDRVCFYVADAVQTSNWFVDHLGFEQIESHQDENTYTTKLVQPLSVWNPDFPPICFVISSPRNDRSPVADYLKSHPEGIVDVAFCVLDLESILQRARELGVKILQPLHREANIKSARIAGWEALEHTLIEYPENNSVTHPSGGQFQTPLNFIKLDHIVLNVPQGKLQEVVAYYQALFEFEIQQTFTINTPRSGLYSEALVDSTGQVQFNINEPTSPNSQIQEFLEVNRGSGIQHLALQSTNIVDTVTQMRSLGVEFLPTPAAYYTSLKQRLKDDSMLMSDLEFDNLVKAGVLVDWSSSQKESLLKQIFTVPILKENRFFLEIIERNKNIQGFGEGNFQALFEAVEREQAQFLVRNS